jgi:hypothetical protein
MTKTYRMPTDAECIEYGACSLGLTVAEFCRLKKIMDTWAETNFQQYRWDDVVINACMPEAAKLAGDGMLRPVSPLFNAKGDQLHDNYTRAR